MSDLRKKIEQNRKNGSKGGQQTAKVMDDEAKELRARSGGTTCLMRYGREFYKSIRAMRA
jgi:hypothetical protein